MKTLFILLLALFFHTCTSLPELALSDIKYADTFDMGNKAKCQLISSPDDITCLTMNDNLTEETHKSRGKTKYDKLDGKYVCCHVKFRIKASPYSICSYITRNEKGLNDLEEMLDSNGSDDIEIWCNSSSLSIRLFYIAAFILVALI